jgi:hypothetical protein
MNKDSYFKPSLHVNFKQVIIIVVILAIIVSIPFIIGFVQNPEKLSNVVADIKDDFQIKTNSADSKDSLIVTLPIVPVKVNLTIFKQNPQLLTYFGLACIALAILIAITIARSMRR